MIKNNYDYSSHWNEAYEKNPNEKLGWFEQHPIVSLDLIERCNLKKDALIFNAGAGIMVGGKAESILDGIKLAEESIDSGSAKKILELLAAVK